MSEQNTEQPVKVIFKAYPSGEVVAVFPELPGDMDAYNTCGSYLHYGQHGAIMVACKDLRPATPEEYAPLLDELTRVIGYNVRIGHRFSRSDFLKRREACKPPSRM